MSQDISALRREAPEDRVPRPRRSVWTRAVLPAAAIGAFLGLLGYAARDYVVPRLEVKVVRVVLRTADGAAGPGVTTQASGWVEPDPFPVHVAALTEGVVAEVLVGDGQRVAAGQVLARLVPDDARIALARAEAMLGAARQEVASAEARAAAAKTSWDNPVEASRATQAADAEIAAARAEARTAALEADAEDARARQVAEKLRRAEVDLKGGAVPELEVVQLRLDAAAAKAAADAVRGRRESAEAKVRLAESSVTAAKENARLRVGDRNELAQAESALAKARAEALRAEAEQAEAALRVARLEIRAPVAGVVMQRLVEPGMRVPEASSPHVVSLYDPAKLQVRTDVPLAEAAKVGVGTKARIVVEVLPGRTFEGEVTRLVHLADIQKNTIQCKVRIENPAEELRPDMLARVQFLLPATAGSTTAGESSQRVFAPERLLVADENGDEIAWVVDAAEGRAEKRVVERGRGETEGWVEIASGLRAGDQLIDAPGEKLAPGRRVKVTGESQLDHSSAAPGEHGR